jgi:creatinine amidohydrolase
MQLALMAWPQVEDYLKTKKTIFVPVGSTEQHGPTALFNTDYTTSNAIAIEVGRRTDTLVAPPICYGMAEHHLDFPGTISIQPETFIAYINDVIRSLRHHGFQEIVFINGHGGNIAPLTTAFCQALSPKDNTALHLVNWWHQKEVTEYEAEHFGDQNGFHATCGEVSVTMMEHPTAFEAIEKQHFTVEKKRHPWPLAAQEFRKQYPDGRMASNPGLATAEHGEKIFNLAVEGVITKMKEGFSRF